MDADTTKTVAPSTPAEDETDVSDSGFSAGLFSGAILLLVVAVAVGWLAFHRTATKPATARHAPAWVWIPVSQNEDDSSLTCFLVKTQSQADQLAAEMTSFYLPVMSTDHWYILVVPTATARARALEDVAYLDQIRYARQLSSVDVVEMQD